MRIPNREHEARGWRIREIAPDFRLEDVWALPVRGEADDFAALLDVMASIDPANDASAPTRLLFRVRACLGRWFGWDDAADQRAIPGDHAGSLIDRLPDDLRNTTADLDFSAVPFTPLYRTDTEFAAELSNQTVHGVLHLAWAEQDDGRHQGRLAVYVKPRGRVGEAYMALITPFRHFIVYPALLRQIERDWATRTARAR
jgi:hypothetical protein